jgi:alpha-L-fucosidase 2
MPEATEIELLPALPAQWDDGSLVGLRIRGGLTANMRWKAGKILSLELRATNDCAIRLIAPPGQSLLQLRTSDGKGIVSEKEGILKLKGGTQYLAVFR